MLLQVQDLSISYGKNKPVLSGVSFELDKKEIIAIVGESGSGKTTVIRAIQGCLPANGHISRGKILFNGKDITQASSAEKRELSGKSFSMIFQDCGNMINPIRTIGTQYVEYICCHDGLATKAGAYTRACEMLTRMRLPNVENIMHSYPFELSGGMRQRVGIAIAMTFKPAVLLADEPTSALDVTTQAQIVRQIVDVRNEDEAAVIIVTHNLGVASYMANKIMVMKNGQVVESGKREDVIRNPQHPYTRELLASVPMIGGERYVI